MTQRASSPNFFTAPERELIRRELCVQFGQPPRVAEGLFLRTWRSGPQQGEPKVPPAVRSMLERGLVEIRVARIGYRAVFTGPGLTALRALAEDRRALDPVRYAHVRQDLGLDHVEGDVAQR